MIELLIVLVVVSVFVYFPTTVFRKDISKWQELYFIQTLKNDLGYAQQTAILTDEQVEVRISNRDYSITAKGKVISQNELPKELEVVTPILIRYMASTGNIGRIRRITISSKDYLRQYQFQFQMGSGKYVFSKKE